MKILFISEPYIERLLLDYFFLNNSHQFILLKANHTRTSNGEYPNISFYDLEEALRICDSIYILSSEWLPFNLIEHCNAYAANEGKQFYCDGINSEKEDASTNSYIENIMPTIKPDKPNILLLQVGEKTQIERIELNLCFSLNTNGVKYVLHSNSWISKINTMASLLNLYIPYETPEEDEQITIVTIKSDIASMIDNNLDNLYFDEFMRLMKPDYIIMSCENGYDLQENLTNVFKVKFSREIDAFIESEYISLNLNKKKKITLFMGNRPGVNIFEDIKNKLTFPSGVKELNFNT